MSLKHIFLVFILAPLLLACPKNPPKDGVLLFTKTAGYRHECIPIGIASIEYLGKQNDFFVETSEDASKFSEENLERYKAIIFLNTTGDILNEEQEKEFQKFIQNGGGFVGIHSATDTEYDWDWYNNLVGAQFESHPKGQTQAKIQIKDYKHLSTKSLPSIWTHYDEYYNFKNMTNDFVVLANLDETSYKGGTHGENHPISWYKEFDGGRSFYTAMGHVKEAYNNDMFMNHILGGIEYAIGR